MYALENMNLHWIKKDNVYNYTRNIPSAVYAFAWLENQPSDKHWPFMIEELFYTGMAGGLTDDYIADRKEKHREPMLSTAVHQRLKTHLSRFNNPNGNFGSEKKKYDLYHSLYPQIQTCNKTLWCALMIPKEHVSREGMRNTLSMIESEQIYLHQKMFGKLPILNLAERDSVSDSKKNENSISQQKIRAIKQQDLTQFMGGVNA